MTNENESIGGRGNRRGLVRTAVSLEPKQVEAVREIAVKRMIERRVGRVDAGEVVREAIDTQARIPAHVELGYQVIGSAIEWITKLYQEDGPGLEEALRLLEATEKLLISTNELAGTPPAAAERLLEVMAKTREAIQKKIGERGKGKRGRK